MHRNVTLTVSLTMVALSHLSGVWSSHLTGDDEPINSESTEEEELSKVLGSTGTALKRVILFKKNSWQLKQVKLWLWVSDGGDSFVNIFPSAWWTLDTTEGETGVERKYFSIRSSNLTGCMSDGQMIFIWIYFVGRIHSFSSRLSLRLFPLILLVLASKCLDHNNISWSRESRDTREDNNKNEFIKCRTRIQEQTLHVRVLKVFCKKLIFLTKIFHQISVWCLRR